MAKKIVLGLLLAVIVCGVSFAQPEFKLSAGGGFLGDALFTGGKAYKDADDSKAAAAGGGIYAFFDATYVEIDLDLLFNSYDSDTSESDNGTRGGTYFGFSVLGKYPFAVGPGTLFPLVGIDYQMFLAGQYYDKDGGKVGDAIERADIKDPLDPADYDAFSIAAGAGYDFPINDSLYIRGEFLWNFKLDSKNEVKARKDTDGYTLFTSGPRLKVGVGFNF